jgi:putative signal transducing protein
MFCPQCRAEYREGFVECSDCHLPLVAQLPADREMDSETDHPELVVVRTFSTVIDAELAKSALDSVGIECMVTSDDKARNTPGMAFTRGVHVLVKAEDLDAANDVLGIEGIE